MKGKEKAPAATGAQGELGDETKLENDPITIEGEMGPEEAGGTVSPDGPEETEKTDVTYKVSNEEFRQAVFGDPEGDALPMVVSFKGNPANIAGSAWSGQPWREGDKPLPADANNYFTLSVFRPNEAGTYRRRKVHFQALHVVMLDDVGTKVDMERLTLPPSWLLETSEGNYQAGYILEKPLLHGPTADKLMNAIVTAGLCDPGANGPRARLARLPVAINGKHDPVFSCRMKVWEPGRRYLVKDLVEGLQVEMAQRGKPKRERSPAQEMSHQGDAVWIPRPEENAVIATLRARDLYKAPLGDGKHDITCPWVDEHTGAADGGTAYFEPDDRWPIGGFKCQHAHCTNRHVRDLLGFLKVEVSEARMKPTIRVIAGDIHRVVDAAERELSQSRRHYQRGGLVVTVVTDPGTGETRVQDVSKPALARELAGVATWEKYSSKSDEWYRIDPPERHVGVLYDATGYPHLPVLNGLTRQPYLREDGSLMTVAGYDPDSGMFGVFNARQFSVPEHPTQADAVNALAVLLDLVAEFAFASPVDRAASIASMLTAAVRPSLPHAPMFHLRAHTLGSGKSYHCELVTALATPQRGTPTTFPGDDEECRKLLLAELLRAPAVVEFDNLTGDLLAHKSLCTALTSEHLSGRILGVSKTATVSTRALFLSSGNNVGPIQDMTRRCITINLDPACEVPAARTFKRPDLVREVLADRGRYVSAALTIVRAWIEAGRPKTECRSLATYGVWSDLCRQPLLWLGMEDAAASVFESMAEDPDRDTLGRLLSAWRGVFDNRPAMVRDAVNRSSGYNPEHEELKEVLHDIADERGNINRRRLGRWIKRHEGRIVDGLKFTRAGGSRSAEAWQVESVTSVKSVSTGVVGKSGSGHVPGVAVAADGAPEPVDHRRPAWALPSSGEGV
ncbi:MAG: hypothetical protein ACE5FN_12115 [Leptospirillia bacterium]